MTYSTPEDLVVEFQTLVIMLVKKGFCSMGPTAIPQMTARCYQLVHEFGSL